MKLRRGLPLLSVAWAVLLPEACGSKKPTSDPPPPIDSTTVPVPPVATSGVPVSTFADAAVPGTPLEQARDYENNGQHWMARLVLEPKANGPDGTKTEIEYLALICHEQGDDACVDRCAAKLGTTAKKMKFDGGAPKKVAEPAAPEHKEPENDFAKARELYLKKKSKEARDILEPKVVDGKASKEETRLLKTICKDQGDRMCVALCDAKLK